MNIGFIGAGRVGCSLGGYFIKHGFFISGYYSKSPESAEIAAGLTSGRAYESPEKVIKDSDVIFITVPDGAIESVWNSVKDLDFSHKTVCHCSGVMTSEIFGHVDGAGGGRCSFHPLTAVSNTGQELTETFFTLEGNEKGMDTARTILRQCGNKYQEIDKDNKVRYHAAAVVASNLVVGLLDMALSLYGQCGLEDKTARDAVTSLVTGNVKAVMENGPAKALTGPVKRGDCETVNKHLQILKGDEHEIYRLLSLRLLEIAGLEGADYDMMKGMLVK
ncbi:MAG: Rossmann-like and DUF2520 domain-containing protein [Butyrivibrio sp.]